MKPGDQKFKAKGKFWILLNSNFVLWISGAVFLSLIPFLWQECNSKARTAQIEKLDNEFRCRLDQMEATLERLRDSTDYINGIVPSILKNGNINVKTILYEFKKTPLETEHPKFYSSYKEFDNYNTISVLNELMTLVTDKYQKDSIKLIISRILSNGIISYKDSTKTLNQITDFVNDLDHSLRLNRWKD